MLNVVIELIVCSINIHVFFKNMILLLLSLFTVDCSLCHGPDAQYKDADLVLGVLHGRLGAAGHGFGVSGLRRRAQPRTNNRYDAPP